MIKRRSHHCRQLGRGASHSLLYLAHQTPLLFLCALQTQPQPRPVAPQPAGPPCRCTGRAPGMHRLHGDLRQRGPMQRNKTPLSPCEQTPGGSLGRGAAPSRGLGRVGSGSALSPSPAPASPAPCPRTPLVPRHLRNQCPVTPQPRPNPLIQTGHWGYLTAGHRHRRCLPCAASRHNRAATA